MTDLVLRNARLVPGFGPAGAPELVDVHIVGGSIHSVVEPAETARGLRGAAGATRAIDLEGRRLIPGLWDEHVHMGHWAKSRRRIELSGASSAVEAAAITARSAPTDGIVTGQGFQDALWPDAPHFDLLDVVFPDRPVVLFSHDLHCCWLNSDALRRFGHAGHPSGLLREAPCFEIAKRLDGELTVAELDEAVLEAGLAAAARGVVGIHDLEMGWNLADWERRMAAGFASFRVRSGIYADGLERAAAEGRRSGQALAPLLTVGSFKAITDGSLGTRTAYCVEPYPGTHDHGLLTVPPDLLREQLAHAQRIGLEPAVHAIGDEANRLALDAMIELGTGGRIEHAQLVRREDVPRFAEAGVVASIQPEHAMDDRDIADRFWAGRGDRAFMFRSLLDAGVEVVLGSDAPVAPLDPWQAIAAAVTRSRDGREPWHPEQAVTPAEALAASVRSRIGVGQPADLVALDADPLDAGESLRAMPVALTLCAGAATHSSL